MAHPRVVRYVVEVPGSLAAGLCCVCRGRAEHLNRLWKAESRGQRRKLGFFLEGVEASDPEQDSAAHDQLEADDPPLAHAHVGLLDDDPSALVEPAQDTPAKVNVLLQAALQAQDALLGG